MATSRAVYEILAREQVDLLAFFFRCVTVESATTMSLLEEAIATGWDQIDRYDPERPFGEWLLALAVKLVVSHSRRFPEAILSSDATVLDRVASRCLLSRSRRPLGGREAETESLERLFATLDTDVRRILSLRYKDRARGKPLVDLAGLETSEAADALSGGRVAMGRALVASEFGAGSLARVSSRYTGTARSRNWGDRLDGLGEAYGDLLDASTGADYLCGHGALVTLFERDGHLHRVQFQNAVRQTSRPVAHGPTWRGGRRSRWRAAITYGVFAIVMAGFFGLYLWRTGARPDPDVVITRLILDWTGTRRATAWRVAVVGSDGEALGSREADLASRLDDGAGVVFRSNSAEDFPSSDMARDRFLVGWNPELAWRASETGGLETSGFPSAVLWLEEADLDARLLRITPSLKMIETYHASYRWQIESGPSPFYSPLRLIGTRTGERPHLPRTVRLTLASDGSALLALTAWWSDGTQITLRAAGTIRERVDRLFDPDSYRDGGGDGKEG